MQVKVDFAPWRGNLHVWLFTRDIDEGHHTRRIAQIDSAAPGGFTFVDYNVFSPHTPPPTFVLPLESAHSLADEINRLMPRDRPPTPADIEAAESKGELYATRNHLDDMRRIALQTVPPLDVGQIATLAPVA